MKTRTLLVLVAGAALMSTTAMADGFRFGVSYNSGYHGGYYGGGGGYYGGGYNTCAPAPVVYTRGYAAPAPYYAPSRTVIYNAPRYRPVYRSYPRYRSNFYGRSYYRGGFCR